jgi:outer membrane protein, heavy metal efflux system
MSAPLPVFNRNQGEIQRAQREHEQIAARIHALEADIRTEVRDAYQQFTTAQRVLQRIETNMLERAAHVRQIVEYAYRRGQSRVVSPIC